MLASASEMYMSLPTLAISCVRLWISSGGNGVALAIAFGNATGSTAGSALSSTMTRGSRICSGFSFGLSIPVARYALRAEQVVQIVDARLHVALAVVDALGRDAGQERQDAGGVRRRSHGAPRRGREESACRGQAARSPPPAATPRRPRGSCAPGCRRTSRSARRSARRRRPRGTSSGLASRKSGTPRSP